MIERKVWLENLINELRILSDFEFQKRVWVEGKAKEPWEEWSSWGESMCGLFDDCFFDDLLDKEWDQFGFSDELYQKLSKLRTALNNFEEPKEPYTYRDLVFKPDWYPITIQAKEALEQLEKEMEGRSFEGVIEG